MATGPPDTIDVVLKVSTTEPDEPMLTSMMTLLSLSRMRAQVAVPVALALLSLVTLMQESGMTLLDGIIETVSIPVMAKARIGHFVEAQVLEALEPWVALQRLLPG